METALSEKEAPLGYLGQYCGLTTTGAIHRSNPGERLQSSDSFLCFLVYRYVASQWRVPMCTSSAMPCLL